MTETQENIWYSMRSGEKIPRTPSVKKLWTKLPIELGAGICDIWSKVLSQTRYPHAPFLDGCDGITYHFAYSRKGIPAMAGRLGRL